MFLLPFIIFFALLIGFFLYKHYRVEIDRFLLIKKHRNTIPELKKSLANSSKLYSNLTEEEQVKLFETIIIFKSEKKWDSNLFSEDQIIKESLKACLPIFRKPTNFYPQIKTIDTSRTFREWLSIQEKQFQVEAGKDQLFKFKGEFTNLSEEYFQNKPQLQTKRPELFRLLDLFYNP